MPRHHRLSLPRVQTLLCMAHQDSQGRRQGCQIIALHLQVIRVYLGMCEIKIDSSILLVRQAARQAQRWKGHRLCWQRMCRACAALHSSQDHVSAIVVAIL